VDQRGTEWSETRLRAASVEGALSLVLGDDAAGTRVYRRVDDDLLHLVRVAPPEASERERARFYSEWEHRGEPP
jgi:hypothetical protein